MCTYICISITVILFYPNFIAHCSVLHERAFCHKFTANKRQQQRLISSRFIFVTEACRLHFFGHVALLIPGGIITELTEHCFNHQVTGGDLEGTKVPPD